MRAAALAALGMLAAGGVAAQGLTGCRVPGIRNSVSCGVVQRALDPARPDGPKIDIHYVLAPAMARRKLPDPVFVLAGGPGQSATQIAPTMLAQLNRLNNRRDIVFVDQRGTGRSAPLECEDPQREALADQADPQRQFRLLMQCKSALLKLPYIRTESDLGFFTTTLAMQDLDAVRRQIGAERIDLIGASYGTRAGLEYLRAFPGAVRRAVLDGVAPPDMALPASYSTDGQAAFDALLAACEAEPACQRDHPTLRADWAALLKSLPKQVTAPHPLTGRDETFTLTREMLLAALRGPLYGPAVPRSRMQRRGAMKASSALAPSARRARARSSRWECTFRSSARKTCRAWPTVQTSPAPTSASSSPRCIAACAARGRVGTCRPRSTVSVRAVRRCCC